MKTIKATKTKLILKCREIVNSGKVFESDMHGEMLEFYTAILVGLEPATV